MPAAIISTPMTRSTAPNEASAKAGEAREMAAGEAPWPAATTCAVEGGGPAVGGEVAATDAGSTTLTMVGLLPLVGSTATMTQAPGAYVGAS